MGLTVTSYAILGLLDIRNWTAYELAQQATRSLAYTWPISESQLYAEPKRLRDAGLIEITPAPAGPERQRQVYAITDAGRAELRHWLAEPPTTTPRLHGEILLRCLFAPSGSRHDLLASLDATRTAVEQSVLAGRELLAGYQEGQNPFPQRLHANLVWMTLVNDLHTLLLTWVDDAHREVSSWTDTIHGGAASDQDRRLAELLGTEPERPLPRE